MNNQSYVLLGAVATCLPSDEELGKTYELEHFFRSSDYRALVSDAAVKRYLPEVLDQKRIRTYSSNELHQLAELMKSLHAFFQSLEQGIQKGRLPKWQPEHRPNFFDKKALDQRTKQLDTYGECGSVYTNIHPKNGMDVFEQSTVRTVPENHLESFKQRVLDGEDWGDVLAQAFVEQKYCIQREELPSREEIYREERERKRDKERKKEELHENIQWMCLLYFFVLVCVLGIFTAISSYLFPGLTKWQNPELVLSAAAVLAGAIVYGLYYLYKKLP